MVVVLFIYDIIGSLKFHEELFARFNCLVAQIAGAVEDLVDVEVHLEQPAQISAETSEKRLPEGILLHALLVHVKVKVVAAKAWIY